MKIEGISKAIQGCLLVTLALGMSRAAQSEVLLCNTLGSQSEIENSAIGLDGTFAGGSFVPGPSSAFGSAHAIVGPSGTPPVTFPREVVPIAAGTIEFWSRLSGIPANVPFGPGGGGEAPAFLALRDPVGGNNRFEIEINNNDGLGKGGICGFAGAAGRSACTGGNGTRSYESLLGAGAAEDWHHYALVWDENGIADVPGNREVAVFLDGVLDSNSFRAGANASPLLSGELGLSSTSTNANIIAALAGSEVAIDDLVIRDVAKTDFSDRFDPACVVPVTIDVRPLSERNKIIAKPHVIIPVALLGSDTVDVTLVDPDSLAFGPDGAAPVLGYTAIHDVDHDGTDDLLAFFSYGETGLPVGDGEACLAGLIDGTPFEGCDGVTVIMPGCGLGVELALLLPPLMWLGRRRRLR